MSQQVYSTAEVDALVASIPQGDPGPQGNPGIDGSPGPQGPSASLPMFVVSGGTEAAINAALAAAAGGGDVVLENLPYPPLTASLVLPANVRLRGQARSELIAPATGAINLITASGVFGTPTSLATNAVLFATQVQLASASGFATGSTMFIQKALSGGIFYNHLAEITGITGSVVSFSPPLPFSIATTDTLLIYPIAPKSGIVVEGVTFNGNGNTALTRGIISQGTIGAKFRDIAFHDFPGAAAAYLDYGLACEARGVTAIRSGSAGEADIQFRAQAQLAASDIFSRNASGFGPQFSMCNYSRGSRVSCWRPANRGIKLLGALYNQFDGLEGIGAQSTGIAITLGSSFNSLTNLTAIGNSGAAGNSCGIWFSGDGNKNNVLTNVVSFGNPTYDIALNTNDDNNVIRCARYGTLYNGGASNTVLPT